MGFEFLFGYRNLLHGLIFKKNLIIFYLKSLVFFIRCHSSAGNTMLMILVGLLVLDWPAVPSESNGKI